MDGVHADVDVDGGYEDGGRGFDASELMAYGGSLPSLIAAHKVLSLI